MNPGCFIRLLCAVAVSLTGCAGGRETRTTRPSGQLLPPSDPPSQTHIDPLYSTSVSAPVVLEVTGPEQPKPHEPITIVINVKRQWLVAFDLAITLPAGAKLLSGQLHERIEDHGSREITRQVVFMANEIPTQDVQVELNATGEGYGVSALKSYCFGRPCGMAPVHKRDTTGTANDLNALEKKEKKKEFKTPKGSLGRSVEIGANPAE